MQGVDSSVINTESTFPGVCGVSVAIALGVRDTRQVLS